MNIKRYDHQLSYTLYIMSIHIMYIIKNNINTDTSIWHINQTEAYSNTNVHSNLITAKNRYLFHTQNELYDYPMHYSCYYEVL